MCVLEHSSLILNLHVDCQEEKKEVKIMPYLNQNAENIFSNKEGRKVLAQALRESPTFV
jgi:hypothetical protein